jgi:serine/threonine protein kinase
MAAHDKRAPSPAPASGRRGVDGTKDANRKLLDDYILGEELGQGAFGVVYACQHRTQKIDNRAVKMIDKVETPVKEIKKEAEILDKVNHINIIKFHDVYYEKCFVCIVMDRYQGGDLIAGMQHHWETRQRIPCESVKHIEQQCILALDVLHNACIVHRDVKGDNYLLDRIDIRDMNCLCVLTDFGTAQKCKLAERISGKVGTRTYWSPEFWANDYGQKVDVWAYGVIVYGLLEGRFPFKDEQAAKLRKPKLHDDLPADCVDYVRSLLKKEDGRRSSAAQALEHPWIKDVKGAVAAEVDSDKRLTPRGEQKDWAKDAKEMLNEGGPKNAHRERRYELVERLEQAAQGGPNQHFWNDSWEVTYKHLKKTVTFAWKDEGLCVAGRIYNPDAGKEVPAQQKEEESVSGANTSTTSSLFDKESIVRLLGEHNIEVSKFGQGDAKTLDQFMGEVQLGSSRLMVDGAEYKKNGPSCGRRPAAGGSAPSRWREKVPHRDERKVSGRTQKGGAEPAPRHQA